MIIWGSLYSQISKIKIALPGILTLRLDDPIGYRALLQQSRRGRADFSHRDLMLIRKQKKISVRTNA